MALGAKLKDALHGGALNVVGLQHHDVLALGVDAPRLNGSRAQGGRTGELAPAPLFRESGAGALTDHRQLVGGERRDHRAHQGGSRPIAVAGAIDVEQLGPTALHQALRHRRDNLIACDTVQLEGNESLALSEGRQGIAQAVPVSNVAGAGDALIDVPANDRVASALAPLCVLLPLSGHRDVLLASRNTNVGSNVHGSPPFQ